MFLWFASSAAGWLSVWHSCFSDVCRNRLLGAFNLLKTELAMIDRSQDPNHRLLFANALAAEVDRGLFHVARLQYVAEK